MENKLWEFVEDGDGVGSAARLNMIIGVLVGSFVVIWLAVHNNLSETVFGIYMLASGGIYGLGKWRETAVNMQQIKSDSEAKNAKP